MSIVTVCTYLVNRIFYQPSKRLNQVINQGLKGVMRCMEKAIIRVKTNSIYILVNLASKYTRVMKWKMDHYHQNKIRFISIYPNNMDNLDWIFKAKLKEVTGIDLHMQTPRTSGSDDVKYPTYALESGVAKQLGRYQEKLIITSDQNGIRLCQKTWINKEEWGDIN